MRTVDSAVLLQPDHTMPAVEPADAGVAWLRAHVVRFADGVEHARLRSLTEEVLAGLTAHLVPGPSPTAALVAAAGLPPGTADDVALVAASYQPHTPGSAEADAAADRLVEACGGRTERAAALACLLVQGHAGMPAAIEFRRAGDPGPPVPATRRVTPDGETVLVDLTDAHFGAGAHACPGRDVALAMVESALKE